MNRNLNRKMNRSFTIGFRASPLEQQMIEALCKMYGRKPSELIRELIRQEASRRGITEVPYQIHETAHALK